MPRNTQSNRGGNRGRSKNNNPEGHNQYNSGWTDTARERPFATAAAAAAAVGASVFLWSRRSQITEQLNNLSDQIGDWSDNMNSRQGSEEYELAGSENRFGASSASGSPGNQFSGSSGSSFAGSPASSTPIGSTKRGGGKSGRTPS